MCLDNLQKIKANPHFIEKLQLVYGQSESTTQDDPEQALYSGGFFSSSDKSLMQQVVNASVADLTDLSLPFEDERLHTLLFRYRARNAPQSLNESEIERWQRYRQFKLFDDDSKASIKLPDFLNELEQLGVEYARVPEKLALLKTLYSYAQNL